MTASDPGDDLAASIAANADWCDDCAISRTDPRHSCDKPAGRRVTSIRGSQIKPRLTRWLIKYRVPTGDLTLLSGREGLGKSLVTAWWAAQATHGKLDGLDAPTNVGFVIGEDSASKTVVPRLIAAGADMERTHFITVSDGIADGLPMFPIDTNDTAQFISDNKIDLLIIDPLVGVLDSRLDSHKDHSIRQALGPLGRLAHETGAAVVGIVHEGKGGGDLSNRVLGSRAFTAAARAVLTVSRDPEDDNARLLVMPKSNLGPLDLPAQSFTIDSTTVHTDEGPADMGVIVWGQERDVSLSDLTDPEPADREESDALTAYIRAYLIDNGGESPAKDVYAGIRDTFGPIAKASIYKARNSAGVTTEKGGMKAGWVWKIDP